MQGLKSKKKRYLARVKAREEMANSSQCTLENRCSGTLESRKNSFGRELGGGNVRRGDLGGEDTPGGPVGQGGPGGHAPGGTLVRGVRPDLGDPGGTRRSELTDPGGVRARGTSTFRSLPRNNSQLEVRHYGGLDS